MSAAAGLAAPAGEASYPSLVDRGVLITGGASGIGAAMVEAFVRQGARVAFLDLQAAAGEALAAGLAAARHSPWFAACDLTDIDRLQAAIRDAEAAVGPLTVLVNNAANDQRHAVDSVTSADWDRAMAVNLKHQFFAAQAVRSGMRAAGGGAIVNFSSIAWQMGLPDLIAYTSAKAAVVGMTRSLAREYGGDGIRVNAIAPGAVLTERQLALWLDEARLADILARQCLHERLLADEVARLALFLAADDSRMITKQCFVIDAGLL